MSQDAIRAVLKAYPDGLTALSVSVKVQKPRVGVRKMLSIMPDVYIDRWIRARGRVKYTPIYAIVDVPENTPRPD